MALGFLSGMVLVRIAEKSAVGSYMLLQQAIMALGMALQLGLGAAALRFAPISRGLGGTRATAVLRRRLFGLQLGLWALVVPPLVLIWPWVARKLDSLGWATPPGSWWRRPSSPPSAIWWTATCGRSGSTAFRRRSPTWCRAA